MQAMNSQVSAPSYNPIVVLSCLLVLSFLIHGALLLRSNVLKKMCLFSFDVEIVWCLLANSIASTNNVFEIEG